MSVEDQKVLELEQRKEKIYFGGGTKAIEKQKAMGKMTARERIIALLDEGSFHEYDMFVEHDGRDSECRTSRFRETASSSARA